nr:helix-turn-helix domain-containing protein [uncultured Moellerella sp.]
MMKVKDFSQMNCPVATVLAIIEDRWSTLLIRDLLLGLSRYDEFQTSSGVTNTTLSSRLKHLEGHQIICRVQYQDRPARFEYQLTEKGQDLGLLIVALTQIGNKWQGEQHKEPALLIKNKLTGNPVNMEIIDSKTAKQVPAESLEINAGKGADEKMIWRINRRAMR